MRKTIILFAILVIAFWACSNPKDPNTIEIHKLTADGLGEFIGTIKVSETPYGTLFTPDLRNLTLACMDSICTPRAIAAQERGMARWFPDWLPAAIMTPRTPECTRGHMARATSATCRRSIWMRKAGRPIPFWRRV